ncbi:MAG: hypothetical protein QN168_05570 [Armatimonadota bacterium]|nr:hypothetical protein [Armatimonadota bacterium]
METVRLAQAGGELLSKVLQFTSTLARALGEAIVAAIQRVVPQASIPADLVDPVGFLAVLTLFVILAGVARRIAWIIVAVGWLLIGVRIALMLGGWSAGALLQGRHLP